MTVEELTKFLEKYPQNMQVVFEQFSEYALLYPNDIYTKELCYPRRDGWVHESRPDQACKKYLVFPGN